MRRARGAGCGQGGARPSRLNRSSPRHTKEGHSEDRSPGGSPILWDMVPYWGIHCTPLGFKLHVLPPSDWIAACYITSPRKVIRSLLPSFGTWVRRGALRNLTPQLLRGEQGATPIEQRASKARSADGSAHKPSVPTCRNHPVRASELLLVATHRSLVVRRGLAARLSTWLVLIPRARRGCTTR